jgi:hypothetical protein
MLCCIDISLVVGLTIDESSLKIDIINTPDMYHT